VLGCAIIALRPVLSAANAMHLYGQYCPVARASEIFADRWTMLIVRELLADVNHFNGLERGLPHMSRTLLAERLRRLEQTGVLERSARSRGKRTEYRLTRAGRELQPIIDLFGEWGARWAFGAPRATELDPIILLWWMRRRVAFDQIARWRLLIQFDFRGTPQRSYWLLIDRNDVSVCLKHPGFEVDVIGHPQGSGAARGHTGRSAGPSQLVHLEPHGSSRARRRRGTANADAAATAKQETEREVARTQAGEAALIASDRQSGDTTPPSP
jgi:DNA-binding HxlR family transcriptional regulator